MPAHRQHFQRIREQDALIQALQREADDAKAARDAEERQRKAQAQRQTEYEAEIQDLKRRLESMEAISGGSRRDVSGKLLVSPMW